MVEVGLPLLQEGLAALLRLVEEVVEHGAVAGQLLYAGLSVELGVEARLDHAQRQRTALHHGLRPLHAFVLEALQGHHLVHHAHALGLGCRVLAAQEPYLAGFLLPHDAGQVGGAEAGVETAHLGACLTEDGVLAGDGEVAHQVQHVAAADGVAVHHGYHGLGQTAYLHLHVEHAQTGHAGIVYIAAAALHVHVAARAEGLVAGAGEQHHAYALGLAAVGEGLRELQRGPGGEGVAVAGAVDGNLGYAVVFLEEYLLKVGTWRVVAGSRLARGGVVEMDGGPVSFHSVSVFFIGLSPRRGPRGGCVWV